MRHYIIVKYNETVLDKETLYQAISTLFESARTITGMRDVTLYRSVTDFPNRYDLMICLEMEDDALPHFDRSELHHIWKRDYAKHLASKAIFDSI